MTFIVYITKITTEKKYNKEMNMIYCIAITTGVDNNHPKISIYKNVPGITVLYKGLGHSVQWL